MFMYLHYINTSPFFLLFPANLENGRFLENPYLRNNRTSGPDDPMG